MKPADLMKVMTGVVCLLVPLLLATPASAQCTPPPPGLISWWPAEGVATDLTGGNNGTLSGATTFTAGLVGQAFKLGGAVNDAVGVGAAPNLQLQSFSIEAWISRASTLRASLSAPNDSSAIFSYGLNGYAFGMFDNGRVFLSKAGVDFVASTNAKVTDLGFHHVAVTKDGTVVTFYVDGVAEAAPSYGTVFEFTTNAAVGAAPAGDQFLTTFLGVVDELSVYNLALTANEVQAIVAAGSAGKCQP